MKKVVLAYWQKNQKLFMTKLTSSENRYNNIF